MEDEAHQEILGLLPLVAARLPVDPDNDRSAPSESPMLTGRSLERWLHFAIHGTPSKRKPVRKRRCLTARDEQYLTWIRLQPSVVSGKLDCEAAHTGLDGGMSMKASDLSTIPLTAEEHREYHRIGRTRFEERYAFCCAEVTARLNQDYFARMLPGRMSQEVLDFAPSLDLDESGPHRSDDWLWALGQEDAIKEELYDEDALPPSGPAVVNKMLEKQPVLREYGKGER